MSRDRAKDFFDGKSRVCEVGKRTDIVILDTLHAATIDGKLGPWSQYFLLKEALTLHRDGLVTSVRAEASRHSSFAMTIVPLLRCSSVLGRSSIC